MGLKSMFRWGWRSHTSKSKTVIIPPTLNDASTTIAEPTVPTSVITTEPATSVQASVPRPVSIHEIEGLVLLNPETPIPDTYSEGTFPIDIIALHGINGGAFSTWTHKNGYNWLHDSLPQEFPGARIFSFGYPGKVFGLDIGRVDDFARQLLEDVKRERRTAALQRRPIVFICHSMGGIVVKKALNITTVEKERFATIVSSTYAILFLATPHGGSEAAKTFALLAKLTNTPFMGRLQLTNAKLIRSLRLDSEELLDIARDFRFLAANIKIYSFLEQVKCSPVGIIVDEKSGRMNVSSEANPIPMGGCDHMSIARFESKESHAYKVVLGVLHEVADAATNKAHSKLLEENWPCLQSLSSQGIEERPTTHTTHPKSCTWLKDHPVYRNFSSSASCALLFLKGHPGSGKSTLMSFLYSEHISNPLSSQNIRLSFFFKGNGSVLQRTKLGMLRGFLWQIFQQSVDARNSVMTKWKEKQAALGSEWSWQVGELSELLVEVLRRQRRDVMVFIDAVDEAVDESGSKSGTEIMSYLRFLSSGINTAGGKIRICASCRHYPVYTAGIEAIEIVVEESNRHDLELFIRSQLEGGVQDWQKFPEDDRNMITDAISGKANGVFLWAELRLPKVIKGLNDGAFEMKDLAGLIDSESNELFAMYQSILEHDIDGNLKERVFSFMQWLSCTERPLTLTELRLAVASDTLTDDGFTRCEQTRGFVDSDERMKKLVRSLSGGLAIVVVRDGKKNSVQLFHTTVYEFLHERGLEFLSKYAMNDYSTSESTGTANILGATQLRLSRSCQLYLCMEDVLRLASRDVKKALELYPFLEYATRYWLNHAEKAERHGHDQGQIIDTFEFYPELLEVWRFTYYTIDPRHDPGRCSRDGERGLIHVAATWNLQTVVQRLLQDGTQVDELDEKGNSALHCSSYQGHLELTKMLLEAGANPNLENNHGVSPLQQAAFRGHDEIVPLLIRQGVDVNAAGYFDGLTALQYAAQKGNIVVIRSLIKAGADIERGGGHMGSPLATAAGNDHLDVVNILLSYNADVNSVSGSYGTAINAAIGAGTIVRAEIVQVLLDAGADPNIPGSDGNALQAAVMRERIDLVKLLLNSGAQINSTPGRFRGGVLHAACYVSRNEEYVQFFLDQGADVNALGGEYGTALQAAAFFDSAKQVRLLLSHGADVNLQGGKYGTALQAAVGGLGRSVVQILLDAGADMNIKGGYFDSLLQAAVYTGMDDLAKTLLSRGSDINAEGGYFGTVLQAASVKINPSLAKYLLDNGANPNILGGDFGSPLQAAVKFQRLETVKLLLEHGANVNAINPGGRFALQAAARQDNQAILSLLLDRGAEVNLCSPQSGGTALSEAIVSGNKASVKVLLARGAKLDIYSIEAASNDLNMRNLLRDIR